VELQSSADGALPSPWGLATVGPAPAGGGATYVDGAFVVGGAGTIGGREDAFYIVHQAVPTRGSITARLDAAGGSRGAEAGLMVRGGLDATAPFAFVVARNDSLRMRFRPAPRAPAVETAGPAVSPPLWLRLAWANDAAIASWSSDGEVWTNLQPAGVDLGESLVAGLVSTGPARERGAASATFSSVLVDAGAGAQPIAAGASAGEGAIVFGVSVRPNPVRGRATLEVGIDRAGRVLVEVLDVLGRRVMTHPLEASGPAVYVLPFDTAALPAGTYVVRAVAPAGRRVSSVFVVTGER
jgi:hypothetical protein